MDAVRRKMLGERLTAEDMHAIAFEIADHRYSKMEMAAFLVSSAQAGLDRDEVLHLTRAMVDSGDRLDWQEPLVTDKHCIGGISGNRTSMLIVPIVAAHGMLIPKTSSRAITSPAGTADTMEVFSEVNLAPDILRDIVRHHRGCLAWGGTARLAPVDDELISVERPLGIAAPGQLVASVLAKKLAAGSSHLLVDIAVGPTAKVRQMREALQLRKLFEYVGDRLGLHLEVIITDGRQPLGRGIGPLLENHPQASADLRQIALRLAGRVLEFDPDVRGGQVFAIARDILDSGRALAKMNAIIDAQGRREHAPALGTITYEVSADRSGLVTIIDNFLLARIARMAGAPMDKGAGVDLLKKVGDSGERGEPLYRVHAEFNADFKFARAFNDEHGSGYLIGTAEEVPKFYVEF